MNFRYLALFVTLLLSPLAAATANALDAAADGGSAPVFGDDNTSLSKTEVEKLVGRWAPDMKTAAANDPEARREMLTLALAEKKIATAARALTPQDDPDFYWDMELQIRGALRHLMLKHYLENLEIPDMEALARERYDSEPDKYGRMPEQRLSSHILIRCVPGDCDREQLVKDIAAIQEALASGEDFAALAEKYSDDPGTRGKGGEFQWIRKGEPHVVREYSEAVFALEKPGDVSDRVNTRFGAHIIRLDEIKPAYNLPYEEVKERIIASLVAEYKRLAAMEFDREYGPMGDLEVSDEALDEIFAPYADQAETAEDEAVAAPAGAAD